MNVGANPNMAAAKMAAMNQQRAYLPTGAAGARSYGQEESEAKEVNTEQIQAMLDENSALIVEIITLNNQIKHGKGTTQLSEFTDKLDKKRKKLNKNLMTLAKWADESSEPSPRPAAIPPHIQMQQQQQLHMQQQQQQMYAAQQQQQQQYARAGMTMNPMAGAAGQVQQQTMAHNPNQAQAQAQARYAQAQSQLQAQAYAHAQYQARLNSMGAVAGGHPQYAQMGVQGMVPPQQQQQRYHMPNAMGYGNPMAQQQPHPSLAHQMPMSAPQMQPQSMYNDANGPMGGGYQPWGAPNSSGM